ncbi:MAG TPA: PIG-L family deacetylase [Acidobacteriaceae bacterium]|jgi:LmbE family N-acetylglucosaminyl deacetylase|nr:PIG-L family deacetylase [Acidobacteriaceae bacterium]
MSLRLLCICAHPDDECFAFGGALALYASRGVEVSVLCLTDGQAATNRGTASSNKELGRMRREEFAASCKVLGVTHHEVLDYHDAQLEFEKLSELAAKLVSHMRALRPHIVLTFGGDGAVNTHPDHTVVSAATTAAFHWSGSLKRYITLGNLWQPQKLFYLTTNFFLPDRPAPLPAPWTHTLDISSVFDKKKEAFAQHKSQAPLMNMALPIFEKHGPQERYTLAAAVVPQPAAQSTDLFEAVAE